jgi:hypothetical protein
MYDFESNECCTGTTVIKFGDIEGSCQFVKEGDKSRFLMSMPK